LENDKSVLSENSGTPKSSILIGFSNINHPFWGTPIFGNTSRELTSHIPPIPGSSENHRLKMQIFDGDMLIPRRVFVKAMVFVGFHPTYLQIYKFG